MPRLQELLEAVLPPTQPTEPLAAMLARPAIAPAADGNIFPEADPGFPTMDEPLHDFLAQPPQPDAMQAVRLFSLISLSRF